MVGGKLTWPFTWWDLFNSKKSHSLAHSRRHVRQFYRIQFFNRIIFR